MQKDGGLSEYPGNNAGAAYGTGYCDAQCPHDIKFINGEANILDWNATDSSSGTGRYGTCCVEMDIWEVRISKHKFQRLVLGCIVADFDNQNSTKYSVTAFPKSTRIL